MALGAFVEIEHQGGEVTKARLLAVPPGFQPVVRGQSTQEIAQRLCISEGTVKNQLSRILATLHLRNRTHIIIFAYEHGLAT